MSLFIRINPHVIRKSQIVRVLNDVYCPYPKSRPYETDSQRIVVLRDGTRLRTSVSLDEIEKLLLGDVKP